jgi:NTP pyrophosphatase (non-canonical NTP hydrolase)
MNQNDISMRAFSARNLARCTAPDGFNHPIDGWSLSDWMTATLGELGEAANVVKKLNRYRDGIPGNKESEDELRQMLADELADAFIYLDLMAIAAGIDFPKAILDKFERTSRKINYGGSGQR